MSERPPPPEQGKPGRAALLNRPGSGRWSPTLRRRRLARVLADLRTASGRTAADIAAELGWSTSKVTRLENPHHLIQPKPGEIGRLLDLYGVSADVRDNVTVLVDQARWWDWWFPHRNLLPPRFITYLGLEAEAQHIRLFEPTIIPSVLQTPAYAGALLRAEDPDIDDDTVAALLAVHAERRRFLFDGPAPLTVHLVLGEAAVRQLLGGPAVMVEQLQELLDHDGVQLQILESTTPAPPAVRPFAILAFMEPLDPEVVVLTDALGETIVDDDAQVIRSEVRFERLVQAGAPLPKTRQMIEARILELR